VPSTDSDPISGSLRSAQVRSVLDLFFIIELCGARLYVFLCLGLLRINYKCIVILIIIIISRFFFCVYQSRKLFGVCSCLFVCFVQVVWLCFLF